jgi:tRNA(Ile)-lysidine synthase TilS/MesJ
MGHAAGRVSSIHTFDTPLTSPSTGWIGAEAGGWSTAKHHADNMQLPDRQTIIEGTCRCGRTERLYHFTEMGGPLCERCFPASIERRVGRMLRAHRMVPRRSKVAVALSGGKDSAALFDVLGKLRRGRMSFRLLALHVNMELGDYSQRCVAACEELARWVGVELVTAPVSDWGLRVEETGRWPVCAVCGGIRRPITAILARRAGADVLATGHTLDDQLVYALKDLLSGKPKAPKPVMPQGLVFPQKIKPLFHLPERAMAVYCDLEKLPTVDEDCPLFDPETHRFKRLFEAMESLAPMSKKQLLVSLSRFLKPAKKPEREEHACPVCGEPTYYNPCPLCRVRELQTGDPTPPGAPSVAE